MRLVIGDGGWRSWLMIAALMVDFGGETDNRNGGGGS